MKYDDFPLIEVSGAPLARGRSYGEAARDRIKKSVALYADQVARFGLKRDVLLRHCADFVDRIAAWSPEHLQEMRGISEGADVELWEIVLVNARTEIVQLARREAAVQSLEGELDGCTGVVIMPNRSDTGLLYHGQTWDWRAECVETGVVLRVRREEGPDVLTFTEAGGLARNGFNSQGTTITANYLECDLDYRTPGIPLALIRRRALEADHFATALKLVATTPKSGANNMIVSSVHGFAVNLECAPEESFDIYPKDGLIVHSNHWQSPVARSKVRDTGLINVPDSLYRDFRVREHLERAGNSLSMDDLRVAFDDRFGAPYSVCRPPIENEFGNLSATVAMILCSPAHGTMEVTPMPAVNTKRTTYRLEMEIEPPIAA